MAHTLTGKQPKRISLEKGVFESSGTFYFINTEAMSYPRMKRFYEILPVVVYGRKYTDLLSFIHTLRKKMTTGGDDFKKTYFEVATDLTNWDQYLLDNGGEFIETHIDDVLRFCALFCVTKDEDMTTINDVHMEEKVSNWKKDMYMPDFFLLARSQVPKFRELLKELWQEAKEKGGKLTGPPIT